MTRGKKLVLLLGVLLVLMTVTVLVMEFAPDENAEEEAAVTVFTLDMDQVTGLSWTYEGEEVSLERDAENNWTYPADDAFPLDQSYPDAMVQALSEIQADRIIEEPEDLSEYGLADPVCSITVQADETRQLAIGDETSLGGQRYLSLGDGNVYLVDASLLDDFALGLYDIVAKETIPSMTDVSSFQIQSGSTTLTIDYTEEEGLAYSDQYHWFWNQDGTLTALDTSLTSTLLETITSLSWNSCVAYQATQDQLSQWGLDDPSVIVTVSYVESSQVETNETDEDGQPIYETKETPKTFTLELGDYDGDTCYARLAGSTMVYQVDGSVRDTLAAAKGNDLLPQDVLLMDWTEVTGVDITLDGTTYSLNKTVQEETDEDGNTTETYLYQLDGQTVDIADALDSIQDLEVVGSDAEAQGSKEEISFTFHRDTDYYPTVTLTFYAYDSSSCLESLNGESRLLVDRDGVLDLIETLRGLLTES